MAHRNQCPSTITAVADQLGKCHLAGFYKSFVGPCPTSKGLMVLPLVCPWDCLLWGPTCGPNSHNKAAWRYRPSCTSLQFRLYR